MNGQSPVLLLRPRDSVAIALAELSAGSTLNEHGITVVDRIPEGHKVSLHPMEPGDIVYKFGQPIGTVTTEIPAGAHVHIHNLSPDVERSAAPDTSVPAARAGGGTGATFDGYRRDSGGIGTRNFIGIVSTVNCSATVIRHIAAAFSVDELARYEHVDGVCPITHASGCGMSRDGEGLQILRRSLGGYIRHPNMGGVLVVGLGCEVNDIDGLLQSVGASQGERLRTLSIQEAGGTRAAIAAGIDHIRDLLSIANDARRQPVPVAEIRLGLQCGGSDSFSGITANPALGYAADRLVADGATVILGETPEIYGAEHLLIARARTPEVAEALHRRLAWWQDYVAANGATLNNNPSPGNIAGGISTILEKSLGAVMKSGTSPLCDVVRYAEPISTSGLVFMDSPGYDPCSITGEIASGANLVCFTTGRGSVFGSKPVPSVKLATNSAMAQRMADDIDYDCGTILAGKKTMAQAGEDIYELLLETASGRVSASERNGLGDFEFVPWQIGAVL